MKRGMFTRYAAAFLKYFAGALCWFIVFAYLRLGGIWNVYYAVDGLWMKELKDGLVRNAIGEIAYRSGTITERPQWDDAYFYYVEYHPARMDAPGKFVRLSSLVDVATWRWAGEEGWTWSYVDARHRYVLRRSSDGVNMRVTDR